MNLMQGDRSVTEYEAGFLRLSRYARGIVAFENEKDVRFEDGLRDSLRVLITLQRECELSVLVDKEKITEKVKHVDRDRKRGKNKRDLEPLVQFRGLRNGPNLMGLLKWGFLLLLLGFSLMGIMVGATRASVGRD